MANEPNSFANSRIATYSALALVLFFGYFILDGSTWQGSAQLHTLMELGSTLVALIVGVLALVRFYAKKSDLFLFIGTGFLGTAFLDGYHAVVTSTFFADFLPSGLPSLIPWSWVASRLFLSVFLWVSVLVWRQDAQIAGSRVVSEVTLYIVTAVATLGSFVFFVFAPLPRAYYPDLLFHRPEEFLPAFFFLLTLIGYLRKGHWKHDIFEHWLVISLIVNLFGQLMYMSFSSQLFDAMFDVAHLFKMVSYCLVLTGLLAAMYQLFVRAEQSAKERSQHFEELRRLSEERERLFADTKKNSDERGSLLVEKDRLLAQAGLDACEREKLYDAVRDAVGKLATTSHEIMASVTQQAASAQQQAVAVSQTVSTVEELTRSFEQASETARTVANSAKRADEVSGSGRAAITDSRSAMEQVREQTEGTAENILLLAERAQAIGEIISTVNEIADQTNLLALNAAIEASRAGEHGGGFAVVASEVKALAEQSKKATEQIRQILGEIQKATNMSVISTEEGAKGATKATIVVKNAEETISELSQTISEAARSASQIVAAAGQQSTGMTQILESMRQIEVAARQTLASAKQSEQSTAELNELGQRLGRLIEGK